MHGGECSRVEEVVGVGRGRGAHDDGIDARKHVVQSVLPDHFVDGRRTVVDTRPPAHGEYPHAQCSGPLGHRRADRSQTHEPYGEPRHVPAIGGLPHAAALLVGQLVEALPDGEELTDHELGDRHRGHTRRVRDHDVRP